MGRASRKNSPDCCAAGGPQSEVQSLHGAPNCWPSTAGPAGAEQPLRCRLQLAVLTGVDDHATVLPTARSHSRRQPLPTVGRATGRATASRVESVAPLSAFLLLCRPSLLLPRVTLPLAQYGIGKLPMAMHLPINWESNLNCVCTTAGCLRSTAAQNLRGRRHARATRADLPP